MPSINKLTTHWEIVAVRAKHSAKSHPKPKTLAHLILLNGRDGTAAQASHAEDGQDGGLALDERTVLDGERSHVVPAKAWTWPPNLRRGPQHRLPSSQQHDSHHGTPQRRRAPTLPLILLHFSILPPLHSAPLRPPRQASPTLALLHLLALNAALVMVAVLAHIQTLDLSAPPCTHLSPLASLLRSVHPGLTPCRGPDAVEAWLAWVAGGDGWHWMQFDPWKSKMLWGTERRGGRDGGVGERRRGLGRRKWPSGSVLDRE